LGQLTWQPTLRLPTLKIFWHLGQMNWTGIGESVVTGEK
jgi:hypothetical protein